MLDLINELREHGVRMEMRPHQSATYGDCLDLCFWKDDFHAGYLIAKDQLEFFKDELPGLFYDFFERFMNDFNKRPMRFKHVNVPKID